jgi:hypothetical protein
MKIVACEIFRSELESIAPELAVQASWLPAGLHVDLCRLGEALAGELKDGVLTGADRAVCLYGACHPDIDALVASAGGCRLPGKDCVAAFLSDEERREMEGRKAFVMTPGWLRHWRDIFREGLGWDDVDARQSFGFYDIVILLDFGLQPIDDMEILEFFEYTRTPVEVISASLERFRSVLRDLVEGEIGEQSEEETAKTCPA